MAVPPACLTSLAAAFRPLCPRASSAILAPSSANFRAVARPTPPEAPVNTTTSCLPFRAMPRSYPERWGGTHVLYRPPHVLYPRRRAGSTGRIGNQRRFLMRREHVLSVAGGSVPVGSVAPSFLLARASMAASALPAVAGLP